MRWHRGAFARTDGGCAQSRGSARGTVPGCTRQSAQQGRREGRRLSACVAVACCAGGRRKTPLFTAHQNMDVLLAAVAANRAADRATASELGTRVSCQGQSSISICPRLALSESFQVVNGGQYHEWADLFARHFIEASMGDDLLFFVPTGMRCAAVLRWSICTQMLLLHAQPPDLMEFLRFTAEAR